MTALPDTSFLFALYVPQSNSAVAAAFSTTMKEPLQLTPLLACEFRQSLRFQAWRNSINPREGVPPQVVQTALNRLEADIKNGAAVFPACNISEVLRKAEEISTRHTITGGHRSFDVLHVAAAVQLGATEFLSFDANQRKLATAEKLAVKP
jgi:predicted nucleic acid-binding protein